MAELYSAIRFSFGGYHFTFFANSAESLYFSVKMSVFRLQLCFFCGIVFWILWVAMAIKRQSAQEVTQWTSF